MYQNIFRKFFDEIGVAHKASVYTPIATLFSVARVCSPSVVCRIHALCLNRSTYLNAISQVHVWLQ